jgi:hypothetical protein
MTSSKIIGRWAYRLCFATLAAGLAACASMAPPASPPAAHTTAAEPGTIERLRVVRHDEGGVRLGAVQKLPESGLYQGLSEPEEILGMTQAINTVLGRAVVVSIGQSAGGAIGAAYMVRLRCGGVTYVFQEGRVQFEVGDAVLAEHGLSPSLTRAPR